MVPRPRLVEAALEDVSSFPHLLDAVTHPYTPAPDYEQPGGTEGYLTYCGT